MIYLRLYWDCLLETFRSMRKNPWVVLLPIVYIGIMFVAGMLASPFGIVGGFLMTIVWNLCASSFLYFVGETVRGGKTRPSELKQSFVRFFWPVMNFGFVIWIAQLLLSATLSQNHNREIIMLGITAVGGILFNVVPEVIYQKGLHGGTHIIMASIEFMQAHWLEWLFPAAVFVGTVYGVGYVMGEPHEIFFLLALLGLPVYGVLLYIAMIFRGHLFHALDSTSAYQLKMRYRGR